MNIFISFNFIFIFFTLSPCFLLPASVYFHAFFFVDVVGSRIEFGIKFIFSSSLPPTPTWLSSSSFKLDLCSSACRPCSHKIASWIPSLPLRYNCVGRSHLWRPETASVCDKDNDPVRANKGSNKNDWPSLFLSLSFLISSNKALLVSMPV